MHSIWKMFKFGTIWTTQNANSDCFVLFTCTRQPPQGGRPHGMYQAQRICLKCQTMKYFHEFIGFLQLPHNKATWCNRCQWMHHRITYNKMDHHIWVHHQIIYSIIRLWARMVSASNLCPFACSIELIWLFFVGSFTVPPHGGMQMQPMPPMGYQGHQMPPNVSISHLSRSTIHVY